MNRLWRLLLLTTFCTQAQLTETQLRQAYHSRPDSQDKMRAAYLLSEHLMEADRIDEAQGWLEVVKELNQGRPRDTMTCYIHSLQSELFYYMGLFQFGVQEARHEFELARKLNDSAIMADAQLFIGINYFEMNDLEGARRGLFASRAVFPKKNRKRLRFLVREEHICNNIAQLKLAQNELDSAALYIDKAYGFARDLNSSRGIPNTLQTKGRIFMARNQMDSARIYLGWSNKAALANNFQDILLINHGYLMETTRDPSELRKLNARASELIAQKNINLAFQKLFYASAIQAFKAAGDQKSVIAMQDRTIAIDAKTRVTGNLHIQQISNQYARNENKMLAMQLAELNRQRNIVLLQLFAALLTVLLLVLAVVIFRRKNRLQKALLEQKNDISQDLHDDIGSGLSSILIHADLLRKAPGSSETNKATAARIEGTASEISQRLHTFIWSLNNQNDTLQDFCEYVKEYAFRLFESVPVQLSYKQQIDDPAFVLNGKVRKNLFYCVKEVLNNSLKHASASKVSMVLHQDRRFFQIVITDDGVGLQKENAFGNGLTNIKRRLEAIGGDIQVQSAEGVSVRLFLPVSH